MYSTVFYKTKKAFDYAIKRSKSNSIYSTYYPLLSVTYKEGVTINKSTTIDKIIQFSASTGLTTSSFYGLEKSSKTIQINSSQEIWLSQEIYQKLIGNRLIVSGYTNEDEYLGTIRIVSGNVTSSQGTLIYDGDLNEYNGFEYFTFDLGESINIPTGFLIVKINDELQSLNYFKQKKIIIKKYYKCFNILVVKIPSNKNVYTFNDEINKLSFVNSSEIDYLVKITPNYQIPYESPYHWYLQNINSREAWQLMNSISTNTINSETVEVAIFESQVDIHHPELIGKISEHSFNAVSVVSDLVNPNDYGLNLNDVSICSGTSQSYISSIYHGTGVAGIVAASNSNNDLMLSAGNDKVKVQIISITNIYIGPDMSCDVGDTYTNSVALIESFYRIYNNPKCVVISTSWAIQFHSEIVLNVVDFVITNGRQGKGLLFFASSGNQGQSDVSSPGYYNNIYSVGASNALNNKAGFSNYGNDLFICAPGENILSLSIRGPLGRNLGLPLFKLGGQSQKLPPSGINIKDLIYTNDSLLVADGTSSSCPIVATIAATMIYVNPSLTKTQVIDILAQTARRGDSEQNYEYVNNKSLELGYGIVDHEQAIAEAITLIPGQWLPGDEIVQIQITNSPEETQFGQWIQISTLTTLSPSLPLYLEYINIKVYLGKYEWFLNSYPLIGDFTYSANNITQIMDKTHWVFIPCQSVESPINQRLFVKVTALDNFFNDVTNGFVIDDTGISCYQPCMNTEILVDVKVTFEEIINLNNGVPSDFGLGGHAYKIKIKNLSNVSLNSVELTLYEGSFSSGFSLNNVFQEPQSTAFYIPLNGTTSNTQILDEITPPLLPNEERTFLWFFYVLPIEVFSLGLPINLSVVATQAHTNDFQGYQTQGGLFDYWYELTTSENTVSTLNITTWP